MMHARRWTGNETVVVRGDLFSDSGYGRATRALSAILAGHCGQVFGVSLHEHAARKQNRFGFPVIGDCDLYDDPRFAGCTIVNICLPDGFVAVPGARTIGYFFWETEQFPSWGFWKAKLALMDELWAPSHWQSDVLREKTGRAAIPVIPWPQRRDDAPPPPVSILGDIRAHAPQSLAELDNYLLRVSPPSERDAEHYTEDADHAAGRSHRFDPGRSPRVVDLLGTPGDTFLAIQTDAPRKGLPLLLTAWMLFKQTPEGHAARLVIKMSSLDVTTDLYRLHFHMSVVARRLMRRLALADAGVFFVYDRLSPAQLRALTAASDVFVSATLGEGFGGPIAEALLEGVPAICPYHTACRDLLGPDYPLAVTNRSHRQKLWNNIDVYSPSSVWNVADDASFVACLQRVARMSRAERAALIDAARARLEREVGPAAVSRRIAALFNKEARNITAP